MKYAFYVSGNAGRLRKILKRQEKFLKEVKVVISDDSRNADIEEELQNIGIDFVLYNFRDLPSNKNVYLSDQILSTLQKYAIDYCFSFGDHILKGRLLYEYKDRIINFHPSLLPMYKGRMAIDQALEENSFLLGCSAHFINDGMDAGPVIMQAVMSKEIDRKSGYDGVLDTQIDMLKKIVSAINEGRITISHDEVEIADADYSNVCFFPIV